MLTMKKTLNTTRAVTYRRPGIPALILEGKWLTTKYRLSIGDQVDINYQPKEIRLQKNTPLSLQNQKKRKDKKEFQLQRIQESNNAESRKDENASEGGVETGQR